MRAFLCLIVCTNTYACMYARTCCLNACVMCKCVFGYVWVNTCGLCVQLLYRSTLDL